MLNNCTLKIKHNHAVIECPDKNEYSKLIRNQNELIATMPNHLDSISIKFRKNCTTLILKEYKTQSPTITP